MADQIYGSTGGTEQHISFLLKHVHSESFQICFALLRKTDFYDYDLYPRTPVYLKFKSFKNPFHIINKIKAINELVHKNKIDVIHVFNPDSELLVLIYKMIYGRVPVISVRRNMGYWQSEASKIRHKITSVFLTHIIANCNAIMRSVIVNERVKKTNISVIYNPIIPNRYKTDVTTDFREKYDIKDTDFIIGINANLRPVKDHETFLKAAKEINNKINNTKFILIGEGEVDYVEKLKYLCRKLEMTNNIIFTGEIKNPLPIVKLFDVAVLSSTSEGFSNSLVEYCCSGIPVVATDTGGNSEIIQHNINGYIVNISKPNEIADSVISLLQNKNRMIKFGLMSEKIIKQKLNINKIIKQYQDTYIQIVNKYVKTNKLNILKNQF